MTTVAILPTGVVELRGLPSALQKLFPGGQCEFTVISQPDSKPDSKPYNGFTTAELPASNLPVPSNCTKLIQAAIGALFSKHRREKRADFVLILDDLELANAHQPKVVTDTVRQAAVAHVASLRAAGNGDLADRAEKAFREQVSFHLAVPMVEAWFFADPNGAANAGVEAARLPPQLVANRDPEHFETNDSAYDADTGANCTAWHHLSLRKQRKHRPEWVDRQHRQQHPKAYLAWLMRDPAEKKCSRYRESHEGVNALKNLDWETALQPQEMCVFLRAMVHDIAEMLDILPLPCPGSSAPITARKHSNPNKRTFVLRNI